MTASILDRYLSWMFPDNADELDLRAWLKETFVSSGPLSVRLGGAM